MSDLARGVLKGDRLAVSRAISVIENQEKEYQTLLKEIFPHTGHAFVVGVTGPPGTGKSSLVDRLLKIFREKKNRVAVLAVDPSSPLTGGAILGDRVRMISHTLDEGVYIRSMASRGDEGGLSRAALNAARILDAARYDLIFLETVGIGQAEVEIVRDADVVLVVLMPELGDEVQAAKAGLMEIGDIFVVNKSDLPGGDRVIYNLRSVLASKSGWHQVALKVSSRTGEGMNDVVLKIEEFRAFHEKSEVFAARKLRNLSEELIENVSAIVAESARLRLEGSEDLKRIAEKVLKKKIDPETATRLLLRRFNLSIESSTPEKLKKAED